MADATYDAALHQYRETAKVISLPHAAFLRWLIERGRLEHSPAGEPAGPLAALRDAVARGKAG